MSKIKYSEKFIRLWNIYDNNLCHGKKGSKFTALKAFENYSEDEQDRIIEDTDALMRHFRSQPKPDRCPHLSTWLNQQYFDQEIPSHTKVEVAVADCKVCGNPVHGHKFDLCQDCVHQFHGDKWKEKRGEILTSLGLMKSSGESMSEWSKRCREYLLTNLKSGKLSLTKPLENL